MSKKMHRKVKVFVNDQCAGFLEEVEYKKKYRFSYEHNYNGSPVSLTMPTSSRIYDYDGFPALQNLIKHSHTLPSDQLLIESYHALGLISW